MKAGESHATSLCVEQLFGKEGFARRFQLAIDAFGIRGGPLPTQKWIAERASSFLPAGETISSTSVSKCLAGKQLPENYVRAWALAKAVSADPGWLVFEGQSKAPPPEGITEEMVASARSQ
jgi:hypothetical protein